MALIPTLFISSLPWNLVPVSESLNNSLFGCALKIIGFFTNLTVYKAAVNTPILNMCISFLILCFALICCLDFLERKSFKISCHGLAEYEIFFQIYRSIQLLTCQYNDIHQSTILTVFMVQTLFVVSMSIHLLVSFGKSLAYPSIFMFATMTLVNGGLQLMLFRMFASFQRKSGGLMKHFKNSMYMNESSSRSIKLVRKHVNSFATLKIQFFQGNWFDSETPLVLLDFSCNCAISLIMLQ